MNDVFILTIQHPRCYIKKYFGTFLKQLQINLCNFAFILMKETTKIHRWARSTIMRLILIVQSWKAAVSAIVYIVCPFLSSRKWRQILWRRCIKIIIINAIITIIVRRDECRRFLCWVNHSIIIYTARCCIVVRRICSWRFTKISILIYDALFLRRNKQWRYLFRSNCSTSWEKSRCSSTR